MSGKQQSILLGGLVTALLSTSYLGLINCLCCAGVIAGSMVAVWHHTNTHALTLPAGEGAVMGVATAVVGTLIATVLNLGLSQIGLGAETAMLEWMEEFYSRFMSEEQLEEVMAQARASAGEFSIVNFLIGLIVGSVFGAIGGALGAALFKKQAPEPDEDAPY